MRPGVKWAGMELTYYEECMRTVPAIAKLRAQHRQADVHALVEGVHRSAKEHKIAPGTAWAILCSAYMAWTQQLFEGAARAEGADVVEVTERAIAAAANWTCSAD